MASRSTKPSVTPPNVADAALDAASPGTEGTGLDAAFDELVARVERTVEQLRELDYRVRVAWSMAAADERRHLDVSTNDIAVAVADLGAATEAHDRLVQRIGEMCAVPPADRNLGTIATRLPEAWRARTVAAHREIVENATSAHDAVQMMLGATRSNLNLIGSSIDAAIRSDVKPSAVTYGQNALSSTDAVLLDGRA